MNEYMQPIRCYTDINRRLLNRELKGKYNQIPLLIIPLIAGSPNRFYLPPLFIVRNRCYPPETGDTRIDITAFELIEKTTGRIINLLSYISYIIGKNETPTIGYYYDDYIYYNGKNVLSGIRQGIYCLHLADENNSFSDNYVKQDWYSDYFSIGYFTDTVKFEYRNSKNFAHVWFPEGDYYSFNLRCISKDSGEYFEYKETQKDINGYEFNTFNRTDKLRMLSLMGDSNIFDCIKFMQICDDCWLTDETGFRGKIKIDTVETQQNGNNYLTINIKYYYLDNSIISTDQQTITKLYETNQPGSGLYIGDHEVVLGNNEITW
jgi:hypothetical protein